MNKCTLHPKYRGKRITKRECTQCLSLYLFLHSRPRLPIPPSTKAFKNKKTYTRKKKHKLISD